MSRRRLSAPIVALASVIAAAAAASAAAVLLPVARPAVLESSMPASTATVEHRSDADERQVQVVLETGVPRALTTTRQGTVTAMHCTTGGVLRSGDVVATVDGLPIVALATSTPLWRDLAEGDRGEDVRALQAELARLGVPVGADGVVGSRTVRAARSFLVQRGMPGALLASDVVPQDAFGWIAAPETAVRSCSGVVGAPVPDGGTLLTLPAELRGARLETVPHDAAPGARNLVVGRETIPVGDDGVVGEADALATLTARPEYQAAVASADDGAPTLTASWVLATPVAVDVVPPTALWDVRDGVGCLQPVGGPARRVSIVGSELGQAFVRSDGERLERVRTTPTSERPCR